jgi:hypothetical protein
LELVCCFCLSLSNGRRDCRPFVHETSGPAGLLRPIASHGQKQEAKTNASFIRKPLVPARHENSLGSTARCSGADQALISAPLLIVHESLRAAFVVALITSQLIVGCSPRRRKKLRMDHSSFGGPKVMVIGFRTRIILAKSS